MKILLVAGFFPPFSPNSATRSPALARYLLDRGHDVRVLAARNTLITPTLGHRLPEDKIIYAPVIEAREYAPREIHPGDSTNFYVRLTASALALFNVPDKRAGWLPYAKAAGRQLATTWMPDLIFASAPPNTGLLVAASLANALNVPWIAEFRDLWTEHPYYDRTGIVRAFEKWLEKRTLRGASGLVAVTQGWADLLTSHYNLPVRCVLNGYDENEFQSNVAPPQADGPLTVVYAGGLYGSKRDPRPLFQAISKLGWGKADINVKFYIGFKEVIASLAAEHGVSSCVTASNMIPRDQILQIQQDADVLLLIRWDDPGEDHVLAGKLFEYIGCRRPILSIGRNVGEAADLIRQNGLGVVAADVDDIALHLKNLRQQKKNGGIPAPTKNPPEQFSRRAQFSRLESFFLDIADRR